MGVYPKAWWIRCRPGYHGPCKCEDHGKASKLACLGRFPFFVSLRDPPPLAGTFFAGVPLLPDPPSDRLGGIAAEQSSGNRFHHSPA